MTTWFVDGAFAAQDSYSALNTPSGLVLNMWTHGGIWSGNTSVDWEMQLQIQWVQMVFNVSGSRNGTGSGGSRGSNTKRDTYKKGKL